MGGDKEYLFPSCKSGRTLGSWWSAGPGWCQGLGSNIFSENGLSKTVEQKKKNVQLILYLMDINLQTKTHSTSKASETFQLEWRKRAEIRTNVVSCHIASTDQVPLPSHQTLCLEKHHTTRDKAGSLRFWLKNKQRLAKCWEPLSPISTVGELPLLNYWSALQDFPHTTWCQAPCTCAS